jgi:hypothetical protein
VRSIKHLVFPGHKTIYVCIIVQELESMHCYQREHQGQLMEVPGQRVDFVLRFHVPNELKTNGKLFQQISEGFIGLLFLLFFHSNLLGCELRQTVFRSPTGSIQMLLLVQVSDIGVCSLYE